MIKKALYLLIAIFVGFIFNLLNVPAGWLVGSLFTGIICGIFINKYDFEGRPFKIALAFIGSNIGLMLHMDSLRKIHHLVLPLLLTVIIMITSGFILGNFLQKKTKEMDKKTAFFCCIPGGASEIIGLCGQYGADNRIVAAFHTVRITFFSLLIPLIIGFLNPAIKDPLINHTTINKNQVIFFLLVIILTLLFNKFFGIPGGILIFSIIFGFLINEFVMEVSDVPRYIIGIGQASIGAFVGIRFNKEVLNHLLKIGPITLIIIVIFFLLSIFSSTIFMMLTQMPFSISLLGVVPAGAPEMSVTAIALNIDPTVIASLHIIRIISTFIALPFLMKLFSLKNKDVVFRNGKHL